MSEFLKAYPHARQVTLDKVIESWLETGGSGASKKRSDVKVPTPSTAQERYEQMTKEGGLFLRFLPHCDWYEVVFDVAWFCRVLVIDEASWKHESVGGKRRLADRTELGALPHDHRARVEQLRSYPQLESLLDRKATLFGHSPAGDWSILDGNHRLLALASLHLRDGRPVKPFSIFVGVSHGPCRWHGDPVEWQERPERSPGEKRYILKIW